MYKRLPKIFRQLFFYPLRLLRFIVNLWELIFFGGTKSRAIRILRVNLLSLGITDKPLRELSQLANYARNPKARCAAAIELALWYLRLKDEKNYLTAIYWLERASACKPSEYNLAKITTAKLLCLYGLGRKSDGISCYELFTSQFTPTPDLILARSNLASSSEERVQWINIMLESYCIEPIRLLPGDNCSCYDRLTCSLSLPKIDSGPKVSVLIAAYNAADTLPTALRSLQQQTWTNLEIIVIDDCSPSQDTVIAAERFSSQDKRIKIVRMPENLGAYVCRNEGLDLATGEFVTIHDADDWSHPRKIEIQARYLLENPRVIGCMSDQARCDENLAFTKIRSNGNFIIFNTSSFMFRKSVILHNLGYWDTARFGADNELVRRMQAFLGNGSLKKIRTGPLSFQREATTSVTEDPINGVQGFYYGVRLAYFSAQLFKHLDRKNLYYPKNNLPGNFPRSSLMNPCRTGSSQGPEYYDIIFASDFRSETAETRQMIARIHAARNQGQKVGIVLYYDYSLRLENIRSCAALLSIVDGKNVQIISYGEKAVCGEIIGPDISRHELRQRYTPEVSIVPDPSRVAALADD
jgi:glycosyltransferase involved in cell wall biosynthesis